MRQFNVFVANRLGGLMDVVRRFESTDIRIISLTVVDSADCAIIRMVLSDPERALEIFELAKLPVTESDLLVVKLPDRSSRCCKICKALLAAEISIHYAYPLLVGPHGSAAWPCTSRTTRRRSRRCRGWGSCCSPRRTSRTKTAARERS